MKNEMKLSNISWLSSECLAVEAMLHVNRLNSPKTYQSGPSLSGKNIGNSMGALTEFLCIHPMHVYACMNIQYWRSNFILL